MTKPKFLARVSVIYVVLPAGGGWDGGQCLRSVEWVMAPGKESRFCPRAGKALVESKAPFAVCLIVRTKI